MHETRYLFIAHSNVSTRLVGHMNLMSLRHQALNGAAHRNNVIIGMRREHHNTLRIGLRTLWAIGVVGIRFSTRPARDGVLQVVEYLDIGIISRPIKRQEFRKAVLVVVFVRQFQNGFASLLTQPNQSRPHQLVCPRERSNQPRVHNAGQTCSCCEVYNHMCIVVSLQERGRNGVGYSSFDGFANDVGLLFSPCCEEYLSCRKNGLHTHRNSTRRNRLVSAETECRFFARSSINQHQA